MFHWTIRVAPLLILVVGLWFLAPIADDTANAEVYGRIRYQQPQELFYNYYVGPGPGGVPAQMYVSPQPVPAHVGHTYYTYPPFYPHELMIHHKRAWYTHHPGAGWTRTKAYYSSCWGLWDHLSHMRRF
ncbi:MAG: hypothetical protein JW829_06460 [Pirellulales bacterium]|nr:hypothetical protein [Pirellulales bacterium]